MYSVQRDAEFEKYSRSSLPKLLGIEIQPKYKRKVKHKLLNLVDLTEVRQKVDNSVNLAMVERLYCRFEQFTTAQ